jgi:hypothetical protein
MPSVIPEARTLSATSSVTSRTLNPPEVRSRRSCWKTFTAPDSACGRRAPPREPKRPRSGGPRPTATRGARELGGHEEPEDGGRREEDVQRPHPEEEVDGVGDGVRDAECHERAEVGDREPREP